MKLFFKTLLIITLVLCCSVPAYADNMEDVTVDETLQGWIDEGYPIVSRVNDSSSATYARISTDQTGDYVSVFVQGYNINMSTVKPVFYDENGTAISGDVEAVETVTSGYCKGAYFRVKKLESEAWNIENTGSVNSKSFKFKIESVCDKEVKYENEPFSESIVLYRRDVYFTSFDNIRETLTVYFSTDVALDTTTNPQIVMSYQTYDSENHTFIKNVVKEVQATSVTKEVNKFTGQVEAKAVFSLEGFDYNNAFDIWTPQYEITFKNSLTGQEETYSSYDDNTISQVVGRVSFFQETGEFSYVEGNADVILYYPYWIGGVYKFEDTESKSKYYISDAEAEYLGTERFASACYEKGKGSLTNGDFKDRQYNFLFFNTNTMVLPKEIPTVKVQSEGDAFILSWNKVEGATGYRIYAVSEEGWSGVVAETTDLTCTINKNILYKLSETGNGNVQLKICVYVRNNGVPVEGDLSEAINLDSSVAELNATEKSLNAGKTFKLSVANTEEKVTYKSSNTSVATVNKITGLVTALKKGTAQITATAGETKLTCNITVKTTPQVKYNKKVAKNNQTISVKKGKVVKLTITGKASGIKNKVTTSKKKVASITSNPKKAYVTIKALKKGTSTVKVKINNSVTYKYKIKVK